MSSMRHAGSVPSLVEIVARPKGEAPDWVRDAWIGLRLELVYREVMESEASGVLSTPRSRLGWWWGRLTGKVFRESGYIVDAPRALTMLAAVAPEAADWWWQNCPAFFEPGALFVFDVDACRPCGVPTRAPANR